MGRTRVKAPVAARPISELVDQLHESFGISVDRALLELALTHRSHAFEAGGTPHNERLEFLGDAVLGLVITETLYADHPDLPEGQLARLRSAVVNMRALAGVARTLGLGEYVFLGKGEETTGGRDKDSILGDCLEAVLGAVLLSGDISAARRFIADLFAPLLRDAAGLGAALDWKTSLQELTSELSLGLCEYRLTADGPEHEKSFVAQVWIGDQQWGSGEGRTKKAAEQEAASRAWRSLRARHLAAPPEM